MRRGALYAALLFAGYGSVSALTARGMEQSLSAAQTSQYDDGGTWTLTQSFYGRTGFRECSVRASIRGSVGSVESRCQLAADPPRRDLRASRSLTAREIEIFKTLANASDLYGPGHTGALDGQMSSGVFETLTVSCCGRREHVVLVTTGNPTFQKDGPRRRLLGQLEVLLGEVKQQRIK